MNIDEDKSDEVVAELDDEFRPMGDYDEETEPKSASTDKTRSSMPTWLNSSFKLVCDALSNEMNASKGGLNRVGLPKRTASLHGTRDPNGAQ
jgi:hypothetical protein